jgi:hypothetical protein
MCAPRELRAQDGETALLRASDKGHMTTVAELVRLKADINARHKVCCNSRDRRLFALGRWPLLCAVARQQGIPRFAVARRTG